MSSPRWKGSVLLSASSAYGAYETKRLKEPGTGFAKKETNVTCDCLKSTKFVFFFSAISTSKLDTKKRKSTQRQQAPRESDESNDESTINASQLSSPGKQVFPAISYWVACQTRNGSAINPLKIQSALGSCGLEIYVSRASRKKGSHDLNTLCQVLKEHKNPCLMELVQTSYQHCFR